MKINLPASKNLNINALSGLFSKTTTSYKLIFFQALLKLIHEHPESNERTIISLKDIAIEMAVLSWYPHSFYKLSFGAQDQVGATLDKLNFNVQEHAITNPKTLTSLKSSVTQKYQHMNLGELMRYVPMRILSPFFHKQLRGMTDAKKNRTIISLSNEAFSNEDPVLYRFIDDGKAIEIHPHWLIYFKSSYPILKGWVIYHWIQYLQSRNPNTSGVPLKIEPPIKRSSLTKQTKYWKAIMDIAPVRCIYSDRVLTNSEFSLDHFMPWSYVCHDQLWNLIPALPAANSSKNNHLPSEKYLECFINLQADSLVISREILTENKWKNATESYVNDLHLSYDDLLNKEKVIASYQGLLPAILSIAEQSGFTKNWEF